MLRNALAVIAGFFGWLILWLGIEKVMSALMPEWYGAPQSAFQNAIENGGQFTAESRLLVSHIFIAAILALAAGFIAAAVARENRRPPMILGVLLLALALLKAAMSWNYVPLWYHVIFTALLLPMAVLGGRLRTERPLRR